MKKNAKLNIIHYLLGFIALVSITIFLPKEISSQGSSLQMFVSMPIAVFMIAFVERLIGVFAILALLILSKLVNVNIEDYTQIETTIYMIQLIITGLFWFVLVNIVTELSETIWEFKNSFFKKNIAFSVIIPSTYVLSLWFAQLFLIQVGIMDANEYTLITTATTIVWNVMYCLVGTSTLLILTYPYLNNNLSNEVISRVFQGSDDYIIEKNKKSVIRKNNRHWKVSDKLF